MAPWNCEEWGGGVRERGETATEVAKFNCGKGGKSWKQIATVSTNGLLSTMEMALIFYRINTDENTN